MCVISVLKPRLGFIFIQMDLGPVVSDLGKLIATPLFGTAATALCGNGVSAHQRAYAGSCSPARCTGVVRACASHRLLQHETASGACAI